MATYMLPHFGELNLKNLEDYYDVTIDLNGREMEIDLNFENTEISANRMDIVKRFIENLSTYDKQNKVYIEKDYADEDNDTVRTYVEHHLEEIGKEGLVGIIDFNNEKISPEIQLMQGLQLVRLGLYPDSEDQFATFDYSIGQELTQYLVVINITEKGELEYMTMES